MAKLTKLSSDAVKKKLDEIPNWTITDGKLHREFKFNSFIEAFGFMSSMAIVSESLNHHPEWFNVYNRLVVDLTTHDVAGISQRDFDWAKAAGLILGEIESN